MLFQSFCFRDELGFLICHNIGMCVVNKQFELLEFDYYSVYVDLKYNESYIIGRFYYDKSTKTLYKYSHDRLEIKDIRCIHQGIERGRKKKDGSHFDSLNVLILNWKKQFSLCTI